MAAQREPTKPAPGMLRRFQFSLGSNLARRALSFVNGIIIARHRGSQLWRSQLSSCQLYLHHSSGRYGRWFGVLLVSCWPQPAPPFLRRLCADAGGAILPDGGGGIVAARRVVPYGLGGPAPRPGAPGVSRELSEHPDLERIYLAGGGPAAHRPGAEPERRSRGTAHAVVVGGVWLWVAGPQGRALASRGGICRLRGVLRPWAAARQPGCPRRRAA